jgi:peroxiredoxin
MPGSLEIGDTLSQKFLKFFFMADYALAENPFPIGSLAPDFFLSGVDGDTYSLASFESKPILVVVFMCNHCPYVQAYIERLIALQTQFGDQGVQLVGINPNDETRYPDDSLEKMVEMVRTSGLNFLYLRDSSQTVARAYHAERTPQVFVFDRERKLRYTGGIDNNYRDLAAVTERPLEDALNALVEGREVLKPEAHFIGCSVKWSE